MKEMPVLLMREYWENRNAFLFLPAIITGFFILVGLGLVTYGGNVAVSVEGESVVTMENGRGITDRREQRIEMDDVPVRTLLNDVIFKLSNGTEAERASRMDKLYGGMAGPLMVVLWFVLTFYLISALYEERRDRSILFWKSMPVSDLATVGSKLVSALVVAPLIYLAFIVVLHLVTLLTLTIIAVGGDHSVWDVIWAPSNLLVRWLQLILFIGVTGLWMLPFFSWALLVSSFARSLPFAWVVGVPIGLIIVERVFTGDTAIMRNLTQHAAPFRLQDRVLDMDVVLAGLFSLDMLIGLVVAAAFLAGAIRFRRLSDEI